VAVIRKEKKERQRKGLRCIYISEKGRKEIVLNHHKKKKEPRFIDGRGGGLLW